MRPLEEAYQRCVAGLHSTDTVSLQLPLDRLAVGCRRRDLVIAAVSMLGCHGSFSHTSELPSVLVSDRTDLNPDVLVILRDMADAREKVAGPKVFEFRDVDAPECNCLFVAFPSGQMWIVSRLSASLTPTLLYRILRGIYVARLLAAGATFIHAAAVALDGCAALIVGDKFAGKTTAMLNLLSCTRVSPLTNDKIALIPQQTKLLCTGFPISAGVRRGTFESFPHLLSHVLGGTSFADVGELFANQQAHDQRVHMSVDGLAKLFERQPVTRASLGVILFPVKSEGASASRVTRASEADAEAMVRASLLSTISDVVPLQGFLASCFQSGLPPLLAPRDIAQSIPAYYWHYNSTTYAHSAAEIEALLSPGVEHRAS